MTERIETSRTIHAPASDVFAVLCDPQGHVAIDASGMLQDADGDPVTCTGDTFVVHMDRAALNDFPELGKYDVTVSITDFERDRLISWTVLGRIRPQIGHVYGYRLEPAGDGAATVVTSFYDWSNIDATCARPASSRCCRRARCAPPSASSTARSAAATRGPETGSAAVLQERRYFTKR